MKQSTIAPRNNKLMPEQQEKTPQNTTNLLRDLLEQNQTVLEDETMDFGARIKLVCGMVDEERRDGMEKALSRYAEILTEDTLGFREKISIICDEEEKRKASQYESDRKAGLENDKEGGPGIMVYLMGKKALDKIEQLCIRDGYKIDRIEGVGENIWKLVMSEGTYSASNQLMCLSVYDPEEKEGMKAQPFLMDHDEILRIEGIESDHLWQNPFHNLDGSPKDARKITKRLLEKDAQ